MRLIVLIVLLSSCSNSNNVTALYESAKKCDSFHDYENAVKIYNAILIQDPSNIKALLNRGIDNSHLKRNDSAIADMTAIIRIDSTNILAYFNRGIFNGTIQEFDKSIADFNSAILLKGGDMIWIDRVENPKFNTKFEFEVKMEEIKLERGIVLYYMDSLRSSYNDLSFVINRNFKLEEAYYYRGLVLMQAEKIDEGLLDLEKSAMLNYTPAIETLKKYKK